MKCRDCDVRFVPKPGGSLLAAFGISGSRHTQNRCRRSHQENQLTPVHDALRAGSRAAAAGGLNLGR